MTDLTYNGLALDRVPHLRADSAWVDRQLARPDARVIPFCRDRILDTRAEPTDTTVFLGLDGDTPVFATELPEPAGEARDLRAVVTTLDPAEAATFAYARGMLHWTRHQQFCGTCGSPTTARDGGHVRACRHCDKLHFPRVEPAVIVLVTWQDTCLLARHHNATGYSTLAGFVEPGESLEETVHREIREEAGVTLAAVRYQASQTWPFPAGLMIGYHATAATPDIHVDGRELDDARWFTPDEVRAMPQSRTDSIEHFLVSHWLTG
ncbi:NAD(+) diphosphatase [Actinocrispum wychmicini]|uniref:NAD(+) diphosphatase n=1 Tax=Actinocrispum wychmicini TaxID=1213861 RepID=A0A4R2JUF9_9PSEU|nr:NAD(+) diphosphatase [Actinocrispum wychmicini]TCO60938.1 NAD+ diphosphatase [Actinocrispum wychmicini]